MLNYLSFNHKLLLWSGRNTRKMPWLLEKDPYRIWISEIMLQQTRVDQVIPYYERFLAKFPTITHLADANIDEVLKIWEGLGYYTRARNIHQSSRIVMKDYNGQFPKDYNEIKSLRGIGAYTAAAISAFAFNLKIAAVDGNCIRVISRVFGINSEANQAKSINNYQLIANKCLGMSDPSHFNQAMMDLGATICLPKNPICIECPFEVECYARNEGRISDFPPKKPKIVKVKRLLNYVFLVDKEGNSLIKRRENKDIWKGLYEFILIEKKSKIKLNKSKIKEELGALLTYVSEFSVQVDKYNHQLTHQSLEVIFYKISLSGKIRLKNNSGYLVENVKNFLNFAFPRIVRIYLENDFKKD
ncbi:MAG: A/G-specific adenine glycosylase [Saprospiraceae bacterium]